jgi:hypothetical protein
VDVNYAGGGLTEYKIFDTASNKYDATACKMGDTRRCVRMDCHNSVSYRSRSSKKMMLVVRTTGTAVCGEEGTGRHAANSF